jgi:hypothetical protein
MKVKLKIDVFSHLRSSIQYGKKGEIVKVIKEHQNLFIVENSKGLRYSITKEKVENENM